MPLSAKAKGKQRAIDPEDEVSRGSTCESGPSGVIVRFTEGIPDVSFAIDTTYTIQDIKLLIREHRPTLYNKRLRIIVSGRLLTDDTRLCEWLAAQKQRSANNPHSSSDTRETVVIQCAVGAVIQPGERVREKSEQELLQIRPLRGFDRLTTAGLNQADIASLRTQFHGERGFGFDVENVLDIPQDHNTSGEVIDNYMEHVYRLEESWLDTMQSDTVDTPEDVGNDIEGNSLEPPEGRRRREDTRVEEIVKGLLIGFFFPLMPFFFFTRPRQPIFWDWDWEPSHAIPKSSSGDIVASIESSHTPQEPATGGSAQETESDATPTLRRRRPAADLERTTRPRAPAAYLGFRQLGQPRSVIFTPGTRMAIVTGLLINILLGLWRLLVAAT